MSHAVLSVNAAGQQPLVEPSIPAIDDGREGPAGGPGFPGSGLSLPRLTRRHAAYAAAAIVAAWIAIVIGRAVSDSAAVNNRAAELRAENAQLERRLEASRREVALVQSEAYARLEARAYGVGRNGERAFSLDPGAPPPPRIRLLGSDPQEDVPRAPLEDWLELLFGSG